MTLPARQDLAHLEESVASECWYCAGSGGAPGHSCPVCSATGRVLLPRWQTGGDALAARYWRLRALLAEHDLAEALAARGRPA